MGANTQVPLALGTYRHKLLNLNSRVLEEAGVAITPGKDFGVNQAERYVRFAYTRSISDLEEGVRRLRKFLTG